MLRGIHDVIRNGKATPDLEIFIVDPEVTGALAANQIPVTELLACGDFRFWAETPEMDGVAAQRTLLVLPETTTVADVAELLGVPNLWRVAILPTPRAEGEREPDRSVSAAGDSPLPALGLVPGGTMLFSKQVKGME